MNTAYLEKKIEALEILYQAETERVEALQSSVGRLSSQVSEVESRFINFKQKLRDASY